jgi:hypothetical protein
MSPATTLAAMLEAGTPLPIQIGWGEYLLAEAQARGCAETLDRGGKAPDGYLVKGDAPWDEIISGGIRSGQIRLDGACQLSTPLEVPLPVREEVSMAWLLLSLIGSVELSQGPG